MKKFKISLRFRLECTAFYVVAYLLFLCAYAFMQGSATDISVDAATLGLCVVVAYVMFVLRMCITVDDDCLECKPHTEWRKSLIAIAEISSVVIRKGVLADMIIIFYGDKKSVTLYPEDVYALANCLKERNANIRIVDDKAN